MFGLDFAEFFSMYKWVTVYLLMVIILCIWALISKKPSEDLKLWSVFVLVTIFITPLGSNNGLYPIINNLFVVAPISVLLLDEFCSNNLFAIKATITCVMICIFVSSLLFGINFVFHDYASTGSKRESISLKCDSAANGLLTTKEKKENLEALDSFLYDNGLNDKTLITFGDIPTLSYIFNMKSAIYTTWLDLDSNSLSRLETDLTAIGKLQSLDKPIIIFGKESIDGMTDEAKFEYRKNKLKELENFIAENNYINVFENNEYTVYQAYDINHLSN
jgi:hypothetical protein